MYLSYLHNEQVTGDAKRDERVRGMEGREILFLIGLVMKFLGVAIRVRVSGSCRVKS